MEKQSKTFYTNSLGQMDAGYKSPITVFTSGIQTKIEGDIIKVLEGHAICVDKEELLRAMQYDRGQYGKGYNDGYNKAIEDFAEKLLTDVESFQAEVNGISADLMTLDYFAEYVWEVAEQMKGKE